MGRYLMVVGLLLLGFDLLDESARSVVPLGVGLILTGGFLHVGERR